MDESKLVLPRPVPPPPLTFADPKSVRAALELLKTAKNPLVIVGKVPIGLCPALASLLRAFGTHRVFCILCYQGTAYARAEAEATHFVYVQANRCCCGEARLAPHLPSSLFGQQRKDRPSVPSHPDGQGSAVR
jgi:hypothetical protein